MALLGLGFTAVSLVARRLPVTNMAQLVISVGATFVPLVALGILILAIAVRRPVIVLVSALLLTACVAIQVSWYFVGNPPQIGRSTELRVLSTNLRLGRADAQSFVGLARESADVVTVAELTPEALERYNDAGMAQHFPYAVLLPFAGAGGLGLWSRYPLVELSAPRHPAALMPAARVKIPGVELDPIVASVHIMSPVAGDENTIEDWRRGMDGAKAQLDTFARLAGDAALIVGGDYNSTPDMRQYRDLLTNGFRDAVEQIGAGFGPTFKADSWLPPVITIDHVLTRNAAATAIKTVKLKGSDHRSLLATVQVPLIAGS